MVGNSGRNYAQFVLHLEIIGRVGQPISGAMHLGVENLARILVGRRKVRSFIFFNIYMRGRQRDGANAVSAVHSPKRRTVVAWEGRFSFIGLALRCECEISPQEINGVGLSDFGLTRLIKRCGVFMTCRRRIPAGHLTQRWPLASYRWI